MGKVVISVCSVVLSMVGVVVACHQAMGEVNRAASAVRKYHNA